MAEQTVELIYRVGDRVKVLTRSYSNIGEVRAAFTTRSGKLRFAVQLDGRAEVLGLYAPFNLAPLDRDLSHSLVYPRSPTTGNGDEP